MSVGGGIVGGLHLGQLSTPNWHALCCSTECGFCRWTLVAARPLISQPKQSRCTSENGFAQWYWWTSWHYQEWGLVESQWLSQTHQGPIPPFIASCRQSIHWPSMRPLHSCWFVVLSCPAPAQCGHVPCSMLCKHSCQVASHVPC
jgi:hypothetical protein